VINLTTKFEHSISTHYEDMKGDIKYRKWSGLGSLKVTKNSSKTAKITLVGLHLGR